VRRKIKGDAPIDVLDIEEDGVMFAGVREVSNLFVGDFAKEFIFVRREIKEVGEAVANTFA